MKAREDKGCVDGRLNVYGTQHLKVAGTCSLCCMRNRQLIESGRPVNYSRKRWRQHLLDCAAGRREGCDVDR
jgi:hypothetical protein